MSMNTYPLDEKCVLLITKQLAAAILLQDILESDPDNDLAELPVKIQEKLANSTPWKCASDPELLELLDNDGWADISDAHELLQDEGEADIVHCSEFTGTATVPADFVQYHKSMDDVPFDDAYIACLIPLRQSEPFKQAYASPDDLIKEYADRLGNLAGPGVPIGSLIHDIMGTYTC